MRRADEWQERFWKWLAWLLPRRLVYWCAVRLAAYATQGPWSDQVVGTITILKALERWTEPGVTEQGRGVASAK